MFNKKEHSESLENILSQTEEGQLIWDFRGHVICKEYTTSFRTISLQLVVFPFVSFLNYYSNGEWCTLAWVSSFGKLARTIQNAYHKKEKKRKDNLHKVILNVLAIDKNNEHI